MTAAERTECLRLYIRAMKRFAHKTDQRIASGMIAALGMVALLLGVMIIGRVLA